MGENVRSYFFGVLFLKKTIEKSTARIMNGGIAQVCSSGMDFECGAEFAVGVEVDVAEEESAMVNDWTAELALNSAQ